MPNNRRTFLTWLGAGWFTSFLANLIGAFSSHPQQAASAATGFQPVGTTGDLNRNGQLLNKNSPVGPVLVVRTGSSNNLVAVNPTCTHRGCIVEWQSNQNVFACPCHHAKFSQDGSVLRGPAKEPLKTYQVRIAGSSVLVSD